MGAAHFFAFIVLAAGIAAPSSAADLDAADLLRSVAAGPLAADAERVAAAIEAIDRVPTDAAIDDALALAVGLSGPSLAVLRSPSISEAFARLAPDAPPEHLASLAALAPDVQAALVVLIDAHLAQRMAAAPGQDGAPADLGAMLRAQAALSEATLAALPALRMADAPIQLVECGKYALDLDGVDSLWSCDVGFLVDVGGEDVYRNNAGGSCGGSVPLAAAFALDLDGNDRYLGRAGADCGANGSGLRGSGALVDARGDDQYCQAGAVANGAGFSGAGLLVDGGGNDRYGAGCASGVPKVANGAAFLGSGMLIDARGNDQYAVVADYANGAVLYGTAWLVDLAGVDRYEATRVTPTETAAHEGAAIYGTALLFDRGRDADAYNSTLGGAGAAIGSAYRGVGVLVDDGGDNSFRALPQAASSDERCCVATLGSASSRNTILTGYPPGGIGLLLVGRGDDRYEGAGLTQGASDGFGVGALVDLGGANVFVAHEQAGGENHAHGASAPFGAGVFVDVARRDAVLGVGA